MEELTPEDWRAKYQALEAKGAEVVAEMEAKIAELETPKPPSKDAEKFRKNQAFLNHTILGVSSIDDARRLTPAQIAGIQTIVRGEAFDPDAAKEEEITGLRHRAAMLDVVSRVGVLDVDRAVDHLGKFSTIDAEGRLVDEDGELFDVAAVKQILPLDLQRPRGFPGSGAHAPRPIDDRTNSSPGTDLAKAEKMIGSQAFYNSLDKTERRRLEKVLREQGGRL